MNLLAAKFAAVNLRRVLTLLCVALPAGWESVSGQLPPPDLLLTEPRPALLMIGPLDVHARATSLFMYDDNISLYERPQPARGIHTGHEEPPLGDDFIFSFSPGIILNKASTLEDSRTAFEVDYSPAFIFFVKNDQENSIDHTLRAEGGYAFTKLTLGLVQDYVSTAGGVVDVGTRVSQESYHTAATVRYELTEKTFLQLDGTYRIIDYERFTDSEEWAITATANYQFSGKLTFGVGMTAGQLFVMEQSQARIGGGTNAPTVTVTETRPQTYFGPTLRAGYRTSEKTDVSLSVGGEWRSYDDGTTSFGPVFSLSGNFRPLETTSISVEGHRNEQNSAVLNGQNYIATGFSVAIRQQLRERLSGFLSFSFNRAEYKATERNVHATRNDDYYLLRYGLDAIIGRSWTIGVFHQYREDISSDESFSFDNNQVGLQATWAY